MTEHEQNRAAINVGIADGSVIVTKSSACWGPCELATADGRIKTAKQDGPEGFGKPLCGQSRDYLMADGAVVEASDWHYGRGIDNGILDAFHASR